MGEEQTPADVTVRILRGNPDELEIAVVTAVLAAAVRDAERAGADGSTGRARPGWELREKGRPSWRSGP
ncbi:hypothetical protein CFP65_4198 [Kitasatospora sp. MMS16-BH015]|uniref:acyl-CoA carboxylase epsilon subunit n=1 Tax=Kitasatospora sp. MMS16-BH015 TaxID=2018025 RepID=UPI000CA27641|nr:acyl-CoA carboxylase epsilon subunit [Kitasatospora sp. MMS16-BH015]AUG78952.1 hypothetical protein CFP65_4198 [Kitasatospora sp. MMS16-BH015]